MIEPTRPSSVQRRLRALMGLICTCALWGLSFPVMKALGQHLAIQSPGVSTWFVAAATVVVRFASGAVLLVLSGWSRPTRSEVVQALALGVFSCAGMLLQMDALNFSPASTSAFLTQGYIVILPIAGAVVARAWPRAKTLFCVLASSSGLAVLSGFDWATLHLGRGETETLLAACSFAIQILFLDYRGYRANRPHVTTTIMFGCVAILALPLAVWQARPSDFGLLFATPVALGLLLVLIVPCTVVAFSWMNRYQPEVSASEAGIIYGAEPLFASILCLFLPGFLGGLAGIDYANERLGARLLIGGGLVVFANVMLQLPWPRARARGGTVEHCN